MVRRHLDDLRLIRKALRERFPIPPEARERAVQSVIEALEDPESCPRTRIAALRALAEAEKVNLTDRGQALDFLKHREKQEDAGAGAPVTLVEELVVVQPRTALPAPESTKTALCGPNGPGDGTTAVPADERPSRDGPGGEG